MRLLPALSLFSLLLLPSEGRSETLTLVPDADVGLFEFAPGNNLGASDALQIGTNGSGTRGRALVKFPIAEQIPAGSRIDAVTVTFNIVANSSATADIHDLYRVRLDWEEGSGSGNQGEAATSGQTTWDARRHGSSQWTVPGGVAENDYGAAPIASAFFGGVEPAVFSSTDLLVNAVQSWLDHPGENFGWVLASRTEGTPRSTRRIASRESAELTPTMRIDYTPLRINAVSSQSLEWQGGEAPFEIESTLIPSAGEWETIATSDSNSHDFTTAPEPGSFYRVRSVNPAPETVSYRVTWKATWSSATHPTSFPPGAHFSALYGATHNADFTMWEPGGLATPGIKRMAETGSNSTLNNEISAALSMGIGRDFLPGNGIGSPGQTALTFDISESHPLVSLVCMIAPSPDWFVGVHGLSLIEDGEWLPTKTIALQAYDAGTDSGTDYRSSNSVTNPPQAIFAIDPAGETRPFGTLFFERIN